MTDLALAQLLTELFTAIKMLSGYPMPATFPEVHQLPRAQLEARICQGGCRVKGFYLKGEGVYIDQALDVKNDLPARSILLHELVHYVQGVTGKFDSLPACHGWYAREYEAYQIQNQYLRWEGSTTSYYMDGFVRNCLREIENPKHVGTSQPAPAASDLGKIQHEVTP
jgi:hypothetical protein